MGKDLFYSKVFWFNAITLLLGILGVVNGIYPISPQWFLLINGIGNLFLRFMTDEKIVSIGGVSLDRKDR